MRQARVIDRKAALLRGKAQPAQALLNGAGAGGQDQPKRPYSFQKPGDVTGAANLDILASGNVAR